MLMVIAVCWCLQNIHKSKGGKPVITPPVFYLKACKAPTRAVHITHSLLYMQLSVELLNNATFLQTEPFFLLVGD